MFDNRLILCKILEKIDWKEIFFKENVSQFLFLSE